MDNTDDVKIVFDWDDDDPIVEELSEDKGTRSDVRVIKDGKEYDVIFYRSDILKYEINVWEETKTPFDFIIQGHYLILQDKLDNESVRKRIHDLVAKGYFGDVPPTWEQIHGVGP